MASNFYRANDKPRYYLGHGLELGFITMGILAAFALVFGYKRANKKRDKLLAEGEAARHTPAELSAKGDRAVTFRYMY